MTAEQCGEGFDQVVGSLPPQRAKLLLKHKGSNERIWLQSRLTQAFYQLVSYTRECLRKPLPPLIELKPHAEVAE